MITVRWRDGEETPPGGGFTTALIAVRCMDDETWYLLDGIYECRFGEWIQEESGLFLTAKDFRWLPEDEITPK